jgi:hypothetical protein
MKIHTRLPFSRRGETLVSVVVGTLILALVISGIAAMLSGNASLETDYQKNNAMLLMQASAANIVRKTDTSALNEGDAFYVWKDSATQTFRILTGASNANYEYVNSFGELTNSGTSKEPVYIRSFLVEKKDPSLGGGGQVIKASIRELIRK